MTAGGKVVGVDKEGRAKGAMPPGSRNEGCDRGQRWKHGHSPCQCPHSGCVGSEIPPLDPQNRSVSPSYEHFSPSSRNPYHCCALLEGCKHQLISESAAPSPVPGPLSVPDTCAGLNVLKWCSHPDAVTGAVTLRRGRTGKVTPQRLSPRWEAPRCRSQDKD